MAKDLTVGTPWKVLLSFSLPMLASMVFQQIYGIADSIIAGKFLGEEALAAIGASYPITMLFFAVASGCTVGCSVVISQYFGGKRYSEMKTVVSTTFIFSITLCVVLTILGLVFCEPLLHLVHTPGNIFSQSSTYLSVYISGIIFLFIYNICTGIFFALGNSKAPLVLLISSSLLNIALDLLFVVVFSTGIVGVALATVISQGVVSIFALLLLVKRIARIKTDKEPKLFSFPILRRICVVAFLNITQQSLVSVGDIFVQSVVNGFGSAVIAGYAAAIRLNSIALMSINTLSKSLATFVAQNIGAVKVERVKKGYKAGLFLAVLIAILFSIVFFFFGHLFMTAFMDEIISEKAIEIGELFLRIVTPFYFVVAIKLMLDSIMRGTSHLKTFVFVTFIDLVLRVVFCLTFAKHWNIIGVSLAWPLGWIGSMVFSLFYYLSGKWKTKSRKLWPLSR